MKRLSRGQQQQQQRATSATVCETSKMLFRSYSKKFACSRIRLTNSRCVYVHVRVCLCVVIAVGTLGIRCPAPVFHFTKYNGHVSCGLLHPSALSTKHVN